MWSQKKLVMLRNYILSRFQTLQRDLKYLIGIHASPSLYGTQSKVKRNSIALLYYHR